MSLVSISTIVYVCLLICRKVHDLGIILSYFYKCFSYIKITKTFFRFSQNFCRPSCFPSLKFNNYFDIFLIAKLKIVCIYIINFKWNKLTNKIYCTYSQHTFFDGYEQSVKKKIFSSRECVASPFQYSGLRL